MPNSKGFGLGQTEQDDVSVLAAESSLVVRRADRLRFGSGGDVRV